MSATIGALDALHCGTTTLIDHHASPRAISGSLDAIERGIDIVALRGVLCYEVTDRHGTAGRDAGIDESRRYLAKIESNRDVAGFAGLVGAHASFTLDDDALERLAHLAREHDSAVHIHVAEDACDEIMTQQKYGQSLLDRFERHKLFDRRTIFAHCIHLSAPAIARVNEAQLHVAHNPRSNMNNAVGYAPIQKLACPIQLGTDGIGADMFAEAKAAWFKSRDAGTGISPANVIQMLANSARRASAALRVKLGVLEVGAAADVVVTDYVPFTPLTAGNFPGHFIFAMSSRNVRHVIARGRVGLRDRIAQTCDEPAIRARSQSIATALWKRMESIPA
jgi:cytosine/adenosine deaminase-related metal-dependent hydrolase